jgi:hypothetical protein
VNVWQQQKLNDLRRALAAHLQRRAQLVGDNAQANAVRQLDDQIAECCRTAADIERRLRAMS